MDWHVPDAVRQLLWNLRAAARDRLGGAWALLSARRRPVLLGVASLALLTATVVLYRGVRTEDEAPTDQFVGLYCPVCRLYFEISHREFERLWDRGQYRAGGDGRTLLFPCGRCGELTARRANGPPTEE